MTREIEANVLIRPNGVRVRRTVSGTSFRRTFNRQLNRVAPRFWQGVAREIQSNLRGPRWNVPKRTGRLRRGFDVRYIKGGKALEGGININNDVPYAKYVLGRNPVVEQNLRRDLPRIMRRHRDKLERGAR